MPNVFYCHSLSCIPTVVIQVVKQRWSASNWEVQVFVLRNHCKFCHSFKVSHHELRWLWEVMCHKNKTCALPSIAEVKNARFGSLPLLFDIITNLTLATREQLQHVVRTGVLSKVNADRRHWGSGQITQCLVFVWLAFPIFCFFPTPQQPLPGAAPDSMADMQLRAMLCSKQHLTNNQKQLERKTKHFQNSKAVLLYCLCKYVRYKAYINSWSRYLSAVTVLRSCDLYRA